MTVDVRGKKNLELGVKSKLLFFNYLILSSTVNMLLDIMVINIF